MRAASYETGEKWTSRFSTVIGCVWFFAWTYINGQINFITTGLGFAMRRRRQFPEGMQFIAIPFDRLPPSSGFSRRCRGHQNLSKLMVWSMLWLRFQPQSKLSQWYMERFGGGGKRVRRIGIVAMARKLLIDLWRYLEHGVIPEGVLLRTEIPSFY